MNNEEDEVALARRAAERALAGFGLSVTSPAFNHPVRGSMTVHHAAAAIATKRSTAPLFRAMSLRTLDESIGLDAHTNLRRVVVEVLPRYKVGPGGKRIVTSHTVIYQIPDGSVAIYEYPLLWGGTGGQPPHILIDPRTLYPGCAIPAGSKWATTQRRDSDSIGIVINPLTIFSGFHTGDDRVIFSHEQIESESAQHLLSQQIVITLGKNQTLMSLDGPTEPDRMVWKVGEAIPDTGIVAIVVDTVTGAQTTYMAKFPESIVSDVSIIMPKRMDTGVTPVDKTLFPALAQECAEQWKLDQAYHQKIQDIGKRYSRMLHDSMIVAVTQSSAICMPNNKKEHRRVPIVGGQIIYTLTRKHKLCLTSKVTGLNGDKATCCMIYPAGEAPTTELGQRIDVVHCATSTINRINPMRMHTHTWSAAMLTLAHRFKKMVGLHIIDGVMTMEEALQVIKRTDRSVLMEMERQLLEFYQIVLPENYAFITPETHASDVEELLCRYILNETMQLDGELYTYFDQLWPRDMDKITRWIYEDFKIERQRIYHKGEWSTEKFVVGGYSFLVLDRPPFVIKGAAAPSHSITGTPATDPVAAHDASATRLGSYEALTIQHACPDGTFLRIMRSTSAEGALATALHYVDVDQNASPGLDYVGIPAPMDEFIKLHFDLQGLKMMYDKTEDEDSRMLANLIANPNY